MLVCQWPCIWFCTTAHWYAAGVPETERTGDGSTPKSYPLERGSGALYQQTAERLLRDIEAGSTESGDRLPSERQLCDRYQVSRVTLRSALRTLQDRGVVDSSPSRGWFVREPQPRGDKELDGVTSVPGFTDLAVAKGLSSRSQVRSAKVRPCTLQEAERLRMAPGAELFELDRIRYLDGLAIAIEHNRLPLAICTDLVNVDFERVSLYETLRASDPPQIPSVADYSVEARPASAEEERWLDITEPVPLLVATQLSFNQSGRPIELTTAAYRGDRYLFRASISSYSRARLLNGFT